jgi:hypothetical protein
VTPTGTASGSRATIGAAAAALRASSSAPLARRVYLLWAIAGRCTSCVPWLDPLGARRVGGGLEVYPSKSAKIKRPQQVRADSRQFGIVPGHSDETVERVIAREKTYDLVRKRPSEAAAIAEATDPRDP